MAKGAIGIDGAKRKKVRMSTTFRSPAQKHPATNKAPRIDVVQSDIPVLGSGGFTALWKSAAQQILAVTYWFDPVPHSGPYSVTVSFRGVASM